MATTVQWHGDRWVNRFIVEAINPAATKAAAVVADQMARNFGTEGGGVIGPEGKLLNARMNPQAVLDQSAQEKRLRSQLRYLQNRRKTVAGRFEFSLKDDIKDTRAALRRLTAYKKGGQKYAAAPPGAFPGIRTGHLRRSITFVGPEATGVPGKAAAGTNVKYGRYLEFGTMGFPDISERPGGGFRTVAGQKMAARPWAMRSALQAKGAATAAFTATVRTGMAKLSAEFRKQEGK